MEALVCSTRSIPAVDNLVLCVWNRATPHAELGTWYAAPVCSPAKGWETSHCTQQGHYGGGWIVVKNVPGGYFNERYPSISQRTLLKDVPQGYSPRRPPKDNPQGCSREYAATILPKDIPMVNPKGSAQRIPPKNYQTLGAVVLVKPGACPLLTRVRERPILRHQSRL